MIYDLNKSWGSIRGSLDIGTLSQVRIQNYIKSITVDGFIKDSLSKYVNRDNINGNTSINDFIFKINYRIKNGILTQEDKYVPLTQKQKSRLKYAFDLMITLVLNEVMSFEEIITLYNIYDVNANKLEDLVVHLEAIVVFELRLYSKVDIRNTNFLYLKDKLKDLRYQTKGLYRDENNLKEQLNLIVKAGDLTKIETLLNLLGILDLVFDNTALNIFNLVNGHSSLIDKYIGVFSLLYNYDYDEAKKIAGALNKGEHEEPIYYNIIENDIKRTYIIQGLYGNGLSGVISNRWKIYDKLNDNTIDEEIYDDAREVLLRILDEIEQSLFYVK